jgi:hypothetical protein
MALSKTQISELYVAIFNRASEGSGNTYWQTFSSDDSAAEVASAMLASTAAEDYFGSSLDENQAFIETIYENTLSKTLADDPDGIAYWVGRLDSGESRGQIVSELVAAVGDYEDDVADGTADAATVRAFNQFNNRVEVSNYTADNLQDVPDDFATSLAFGEGGLVVSEDAATVTSAQSSVDAIVNPEAPATGLTALLNELSTAQDSLNDFLAAADGDDDPDTFTTALAIEGDYDTAVTATDALVDGTYDGASTAVKAALLSAQETANAEVLATAEESVADANTAIAEVDGLTAAVAAAKAAADAEDAATEAAANAQVAEEAASASWVVTANGGAKVDGAINSTGVLTVDVDDATNAVFANDTVLTLTEVDANTGVVSLADADSGWDADQVAVFEAQQGLAADLIAKYNASISADAAKTSAVDASDAADLEAALLDKGDDAATVTALSDVGAGFTETTAANAAEPTAAEIAAEITALTKIENDGQSALASDIALVGWAGSEEDTETAHATVVGQAVTDGFIDATSETAINAAFDAALTAEADLNAAAEASIDALEDATNTAGALDTFEDLVDAYYTAELADTPLIEDLVTAETAVVAAQDTIDTLDEVVTEEQTLLDQLTQAGVLQDAVDDAEQALTDADFVVSTVGISQTATADNDAYLVGDVEGTISGFGNEGSDSLFVGTDYVLNTGDVETDGVDSALEIFLTEDAGGNTTVTLETSAFGSNAATPEILEIVLTGVGADELVLNDGLLTIA